MFTRTNHTKPMFCKWNTVWQIFKDGKLLTIFPWYRYSIYMYGYGKSKSLKFKGTKMNCLYDLRCLWIFHNRLYTCNKITVKACLLYRHNQYSSYPVQLDQHPIQWINWLSIRSDTNYQPESDLFGLRTTGMCYPTDINLSP